MSALTKPQYVFTNAINNTTVVPVEHVESIDKVDIAAAPNAPASTATFNLLFTIVYPNSFMKNITIKFASSAARNTSLTNYLAAAASSIA